MTRGTQRKRTASVGAAILVALSTARVATETQIAPPAPAAAPAGNVERGKLLYLKYGCYECHGNEGQGGAAGPRLGPDPIPLRGFVAYVRAPRGEMPPYTVKVLSEQELAAMYSFLEARPRPPALRSIPLLAPLEDRLADARRRDRNAHRGLPPECKNDMVEVLSGDNHSCRNR